MSPEAPGGWKGQGRLRAVCPPPVLAPSGVGKGTPTEFQGILLSFSPSSQGDSGQTDSSPERDTVEQGEDQSLFSEGQTGFIAIPTLSQGLPEWTPIGKGFCAPERA